MLDALNELDAQASLTETPVDGAQNIAYATGRFSGYISMQNAPRALEPGSIDLAIERLLAEFQDAAVDYIHGDAECRALAAWGGNIALFMPAIGKDTLFEMVEQNGALPKKAFSMGEADEKRCYLECRKIQP